MLEKLFEMYDGDRPRFDSDIYQVGSDYSPSRPSRSYHPGRVYGSGHYGNDEQERRYQCFIRDPYLVFDVLDELLRKEATLRSESRRYKWDVKMTIPNIPTEIEEGEIVDEEPFIRAPVISRWAGLIMEEVFDDH